MIAFATSGGTEIHLGPWTKLGATNGSFPWNICSEDLDRIFGHSDEKLARVLGKTFILCVSNVEQIKNSSP